MDKKARSAILSALFLVAVLLAGLVTAKPVMGAQPQCKDGVDNDGDGYTDWPDDTGCTDKNDKTETNPYVECDDGIDNDGDGSADMGDSGCLSPADGDETNCGDGVCEGGETSGTCPEDCGYLDSCSDSDGGNIATVFGTTSGYYNNNPYSNDDYCVDTGSIMEYYCIGDYEQSQQQSCGTDGYGSLYCSAGDTIYKDFTDYFCASGACGSDVIPVFQEDCDDSDGYSTNYCMNSSVYRDYNDYYCIGGACAYSAAHEVVVDLCQYGCTDGECNPAPDSCSDSDGGWFPELLGTVSGYLNDQQYSYDDYCFNNITLMEYSCSGSYAYNGIVSCIGNLTASCLNGACV
ncbi:hypothetical protein KY347_07205 [Candidatus Woesearchaeota archaeon]|nr:hypothetical protein [Candidatus Woesearchaeota archaeon]